MSFLLNAGLVLHICGISLMVGMTVAGFVTYRRLFDLLAEDKNSGTTLMATAGIFSRLQLLGGLFIISGGILMMIALQGIIMTQLWFKLKVSLLLLLIINVPLTFYPARIRLRQFLTATQPEASDLFKVRQLFNQFHMLQLLIFLGIFILSVFRFN
ncbi:hypothetical protein ACTHGU_04975 [Chitinophagaceae bacterium MMS25-I14]